MTCVPLQCCSGTPQLPKLMWPLGDYWECWNSHKATTTGQMCLHKISKLLQPQPHPWIDLYFISVWDYFVVFLSCVFAVCTLTMSDLNGTYNFLLLSYKIYDLFFENSPPHFSYCFCGESLIRDKMNASGWQTLTCLFRVTWPNWNIVQVNINFKSSGWILGC